MKRAVIVALACINAVLLVALVLGVGVPQARAQIAFGQDYLMVTGAMPGSSADAVYIVDLAKGRMVGMKFDRQRMDLSPMGARNLKNDFRQGARP